MEEDYNLNPIENRRVHSHLSALRTAVSSSGAFRVIRADSRTRVKSNKRVKVTMNRALADLLDQHTLAPLTMLRNTLCCIITVNIISVFTLDLTKFKYGILKILQASSTFSGITQQSDSHHDP